MKTFAGAYVNLLKTSIGSGVLNFPYLFKTYGICPAVLLTILCGYLSSIGLVLLAMCAQEVGRTADLSRLSQIAIPYARFFVNFAVFLKCFGVSLSYVIITRQLLPSIIETALVGKSVLSDPRFCLLLFLLIVGPFAFLVKLDKLKYTSFLGLLCIIIVICAAVFRYMQKAEDDVVPHFFVPISMVWLGGLGKFIFSFTCHQNIFAVNSEMEDNSLPRMKNLILCVALTAFVLYMLFGTPNYLLYGDAVADNVLKNYPQDNLATLVRGLYVIVMGVSYPLQVAPARVYLLNMLNVPAVKRKPNVLHFTVTFLIILATYIIAISGVNLGVVYTIVGATASTFMSLLLPALFYFHMDVERTVFLSVMAYIAFLFGIFVFISTLVSILLNIH